MYLWLLLITNHWLFFQPKYQTKNKGGGVCGLECALEPFGLQFFRHHWTRPNSTTHHHHRYLSRDRHHRSDLRRTLWVATMAKRFRGLGCLRATHWCGGDQDCTITALVGMASPLYLDANGITIRCHPWGKALIGQRMPLRRGDGGITEILMVDQ